MGKSLQEEQTASGTPLGRHDLRLQEHEQGEAARERDNCLGLQVTNRVLVFTLV